jgi:hypothetical protein
MRFTIRDLLWLMLVVGLWVSWWLDRRQLQDERRELQYQLVWARADVNTWKIHFSSVHGVYRKAYPHESESLDELRRQAQLGSNE